MAPGVNTRSVAAIKANLTLQQSKPYGPVNQVSRRRRIAGRRAFVFRRQNQTSESEPSASAVKEEIVHDTSARRTPTADVKVLNTVSKRDMNAGPALVRSPDDSKVGTCKSSDIDHCLINNGAGHGDQRMEEHDALPADHSHVSSLRISQLDSKVEKVADENASRLTQNATQNSQHPRSSETSVVGVFANSVVSPSLESQTSTYSQFGNGLLEKLVLMAPPEMTISQLRTEIRFPGILKFASNLQQTESIMNGCYRVSPTVGEGANHPIRANNNCDAHAEDGNLDATAENIFHFLKVKRGEAIDQAARAAATGEWPVNKHAEKTYDFLSKKTALTDLSSPSELSRPEVSIPLQKSAPHHDYVNKELYQNGIPGIHFLDRGGNQEHSENRNWSHDQSEGYVQVDPGHGSSNHCQLVGDYPCDPSQFHSHEDHRVLPAQCRPIGYEMHMVQRIQQPTEQHEQSYQSEGPHNHGGLAGVHQEHGSERPTYSFDARSHGEMPTLSRSEHSPADNQGYFASHFQSLLRLGVNEENLNRAIALPHPRNGLIHNNVPVDRRDFSTESELHSVQSNIPISLLVPGFGQHTSSESDAVKSDQFRHLQSGSGHVFPFFSQVPGSEVHDQTMMTLGLNRAPGRFAEASEAAVGAIPHNTLPSVQFLSHSELPQVEQLNHGSRNEKQPLDHSSFDLYDIRCHPHLRPFRQHGKFHSSPSSGFVPFTGHKEIQHPTSSIVYGQQDTLHNGNFNTISQTQSYYSAVPPQPPPFQPLDRNHSLGLSLKGEPVTFPVDLQNQVSPVPLLRRPKVDDWNEFEYCNTKKPRDIHRSQLEAQYPIKDSTFEDSRPKTVSSRQDGVHDRRRSPVGNHEHRNTSKRKTGLSSTRGRRRLFSKSPLAYGFHNACDSLYPPNISVEVLKKFKLYSFPMWIDYKHEMEEVIDLFSEAISFSTKKIGRPAPHVQHVVNEGITLADSFIWSNFARNLKGEADIMACLVPPGNGRMTSDSLRERRGIYQTQLNEIDDWYMDFRSTLQYINRIFDTCVKYPMSKCYSQYPILEVSRRLRRYRDCFVQHIKAVKRALGEESRVPGFNSRIRTRRAAIHQAQHDRIISNLHSHSAAQNSAAWRPQRGLPDRAVVVLKAWLFGHFLHPYPKDVDKEHLAKETGLTRGQVSNWFINARVRVWKPMIEDMYRREYPNGPGPQDPQVTVAAQTQTVVKREEVVPPSSKKHLPNSYVSRPRNKRQCTDPSLASREQNHDSSVVAAQTSNTIDNNPMAPQPSTIVPNPFVTTLNLLPLQTYLTSVCKAEAYHEIELAPGTSRAPLCPTQSDSSNGNTLSFPPESREVLAQFLSSAALKTLWSKVKDPKTLDPRIISTIIKECHRVSQLGCLPKNGAFRRFLVPGQAARSQNAPRGYPQMSLANRVVADSENLDGNQITKLVCPDDQLAMMRKGKHIAHETV